MDLELLKKLDDAMKKRGDSPAACALALGVSLKTYYNWRNGSTSNRSAAVDAMIKAYIEQAEIPNRVECSWCHEEMTPGREPTSHGIHDECREKYFPGVKKTEKKEEEGKETR